VGRVSAEPAAAAIPGVLEREAVTRPRAIRAGIAAVILTVITIAIAALAQGARPTVTLLDALNVAAGVPLDRPGLTSELLRYYDDTFLPFLAIAIAQGLSFIAYGAVLLVLVDAVTARGVKVPRVARPAAATGAVLSERADN